MCPEKSRVVSAWKYTVSEVMRSILPKGIFLKEKGEHQGTCIRWYLRKRCSRVKEIESFWKIHFFVAAVDLNNLK